MSVSSHRFGKPDSVSMPAKQVVYIGDGSYLIGVPACDMTLPEWEALPETTRTAAIQQQLYQVGTVRRALAWNEKRGAEPKEQ
jgi:hypothetical protein